VASNTIPQPSNDIQLDLALEAPDSVLRGDSVRFLLRLTNRGADPLAIETTSPIPQFNVVIREPDGDWVWDWLAGKGLPMAGQVLTLRPGEPLVMEAIWSGRDLRGVPLARGVPPPPGSLGADRGKAAAPGRYFVQGEIRLAIAGKIRALRTNPHLLLIMKPRG